MGRVRDEIARRSQRPLVPIRTVARWPRQIAITTSLESGRATGFACARIWSRSTDPVLGLAHVAGGAPHCDRELGVSSEPDRERPFRHALGHRHLAAAGRDRHCPRAGRVGRPGSSMARCDSRSRRIRLRRTGRRDGRTCRPERDQRGLGPQPHPPRLRRPGTHRGPRLRLGGLARGPACGNPHPTNLHARRHQALGRRSGGHRRAPVREDRGRRAPGGAGLAAQSASGRASGHRGARRRGALPARRRRPRRRLVRHLHAPQRKCRFRDGRCRGTWPPSGSSHGPAAQRTACLRPRSRRPGRGAAPPRSQALLLRERHLGHRRVRA